MAPKGISEMESTKVALLKGGEVQGVSVQVTRREVWPRVALHARRGQRWRGDPGHVLTPLPSTQEGSGEGVLDGWKGGEELPREREAQLDFL